MIRLPAREKIQAILKALLEMIAVSDADEWIDKKPKVAKVTNGPSNPAALPTSTRHPREHPKAQGEGSPQDGDKAKEKRERKGWERQQGESTCRRDAVWDGGRSGPTRVEPRFEQPKVRLGGGGWGTTTTQESEPRFQPRFKASFKRGFNPGSNPDSNPYPLTCPQTIRIRNQSIHKLIFTSQTCIALFSFSKHGESHIECPSLQIW